MKKKQVVMNKKLALEIRDLRYNKSNCTWRSVAAKFAGAHPELDICSGNQIEGMDLCQQAMKFLGENNEDGWN